MNSAFAQLLSTPMSRKDFLIRLGVIVLAISGISGLLKVVSDPHLITKKQISGFGSGPYGG